MKRTSSGFTLVELLVVIGIIALLISILLPALSKAQSAAKVVQCLSNQRQIAMGMLMFANDNKGVMPGASWNNENTNDVNAQWGYGGVGQFFILPSYGAAVWLSPGAEKESAAAGWVGTSSLVAQKYVSSRAVFQCPELAGNPGFFDAIARTASLPFITQGSAVQYGFNASLVGDSFSPTSNRIAVRRLANRPGLKMTQVRSGGSKTVLISDWVSWNDSFWNDADYFSFPTALSCDIPGPYNAAQATALHSNFTKAVVTYVDGHGELQPVHFGNPPKSTNKPSIGYAGYVPSDGNGISFWK